MNSDDVLLLMTSGEEKLETDACRMLPSLAELDEPLETAILLNYHRLNLALLHAPKHFEKMSSLTLHEDEESAIFSFDASGFRDLHRLPKLKSIRVESMQKQDLALLLETLATQDHRLDEFSTVLPLTRIPKVSETKFTVRRLASHNWDSVVPYLKFWNCFRPGGLKEMHLFDMFSVLLPSPLSHFPNIEALSLTVKHKIFSLQTFFKSAQGSDSLKRLHFESRILVGDYSPSKKGQIGENALDFSLLERFPRLEKLSIGIPPMACKVETIAALRSLRQVKHIELTGATSEMAARLAATFPDGNVTYDTTSGQGKALLKR